MSLLNLPDNLVHAFGWTLLHSLWQGGLIVLALVVFMKKFTEARTRYLASAAALLALMVSALLTFLHLMVQSGHQTILLAATEPLTQALPFDAFLRFADERLSFMVQAWMIGVGVFATRFAGGLLYTRRLTQRLSPFGSAWQGRVATLAGRLGIKKTITFAESALVRVPMTIGFFKPVILFPLGLLCQLSPQQLEAVLLHELGHIARRDYFFNILQTTTEIFFFFNPASWWINARMRLEREHCCDDLAVAVTRDPVCFAKMLVQLRELEPVNSGLAMAASGNGDLKFRIRRLIEGQNAGTVPDRSGAMLLVLSALFALVALAPTNRGSIEELGTGPSARLEQELALAQLESMEQIMVERVVMNEEQLIMLKEREGFLLEQQLLELRESAKQDRTIQREKVRLLREDNAAEAQLLGHDELALQLEQLSLAEQEMGREWARMETSKKELDTLRKKTETMKTRLQNLETMRIRSQKRLMELETRKRLVAERRQKAEQGTRLLEGRLKAKSTESATVENR